MGHKVVIVIVLIIALGLGLYLIRSGVVSKSFSLFGDLKTRLAVSSSSSIAEETGVGPSPSFFSPPPPTYSTPPPPPPFFVVSNVEPLPQPQQTVNPDEIPVGFKIGDLSPYFHKVRFAGVSPGSEFSYGQISLYANVSGDEKINVTGWLMRARDGSQFVPGAVAVYDPSGLARESDIYLGEGNMLNIYSSQSAIGLNLRLNKCLGYLENYNHFTPSLPLDCPYPYNDRYGISNFSGECQDYLSSLGGCRLPDDNPPVPDNDYACRAFLDTQNHKGCFDKHRSDADFFGREIWAWAGSRFLDERHDKILLLDKRGLIVDVYNY